MLQMATEVRSSWNGREGATAVEDLPRLARTRLRQARTKSQRKRASSKTKQPWMASLLFAGKEVQISSDAGIVSVMVQQRRRESLMKRQRLREMIWSNKGSNQFSLKEIGVIVKE